MTQYVNYYEYIRSDLWFEITNRTQERNGGQCELCLFRSSFYTHHRTYKNLGSEKEEDLIALCRGCHAAMHKIPGYENHYIWESRREFLKELQTEIEKELKR